MKHRKTLTHLSAMVVTLFAFSSLAMAQRDDWSASLKEDIEGIDAAFSGELGVYVRHLSDDQTVAHNTGQDWYLASTVKIPLAIALMQRAENEGLDLEQKLTLRDSDYVDGSGDLLWVGPGAQYSLEELNRRSIEDSDSTATDMLMRFLGEESFNEQTQAMAPEGMGPITTILQVRYDAYSEVHPSVSKLSNRDFIELKIADSYQARYTMLLEKLSVTPAEAKAEGIHQAFERYYERGINSGSLESFGRLLEQLVKGELLNEAHTERLIGYLSEITTGDHRIAGGMPRGVRFAHKTGTQVARSCDIGVLNPQTPEDALVVAVCAKDYVTLQDAEKAYQAIGRALQKAGLPRQT
ncbi:beta-lactamase class A [Marinobacter sp. LV10R520-4]|uniref:serine hydrolase n=1 Tax=Marinobacter sp. LV10R520-4 TaxID=1761796 RepID=UPI000BF63495|nr:serine hydrolase [Marinobacter sp. LV10R520-4]PFG53400.1 beta-lactamase class A [Marinobacter sp. LV10R520-4]